MKPELVQKELYDRIASDYEAHYDDEESQRFRDTFIYPHLLGQLDFSDHGSPLQQNGNLDHRTAARPKAIHVPRQPGTPCHSGIGPNGEMLVVARTG